MERQTHTRRDADESLVSEAIHEIDTSTHTRGSFPRKLSAFFRARARVVQRALSVFQCFVFFIEMVDGSLGINCVG